MAACKSCESERIMSVTGKCSDMCVVGYDCVDKEGYVPHDVGIGGGDYIDFNLCMQCGRIQSVFPVDEQIVRQAVQGE